MSSDAEPCLERETRPERLRLFGRELPVPQSRGLRVALGAALVVGGVLGFLPVLGFWMIPLGLSVLAIDIPWVARRRARAAASLRRRFPETMRRLS